MKKGKLSTTDRRTASRRSAGFTLVEVLVAVAIVGIVFTVLLEAFTVGLRMLEQSRHTTIAAGLAEEIHEMVLTLPLSDPEQPTNWGLEAGESAPDFDDLDDLDGLVISPPLTSDGFVLADRANYAQQVTVVSVSATDFNQVVADGASDVYRISVSITYQGGEVCQLSWLRMPLPSGLSAKDGDDDEDGDDVDDDDDDDDDDMMMTTTIRRSPGRRGRSPDTTTFVGGRRKRGM